MTYRLRRPLRRVAVLRIRTTAGRVLSFSELRPATAAAIAGHVAGARMRCARGRVVSEPPLFDRLPEQYFTRILAAAVARATRPARALIDLGRGNPDLPPPAHAIAALRAAALETATRGGPRLSAVPGPRATCAPRSPSATSPTTASSSIPSARSRSCRGRRPGSCSPRSRRRGSGDAVLLPDPGYPDYRSAVALAAAREVALPLDASAGHQPDFGAVPAAERERARLLVLNYPSNPLAVCAAPGTFDAAVAFAREHGCWLLNDLAYGFLAFDGRRGASVLESAGARDVAIELWSPSKIYGMAGWRMGFAVGAAELVGRIKTLVDHTTAGVWTGLQRGLVAALRGDQEHVARRREVYRLRRDALVGTLRAAGAEIDAPQGRSTRGGARRRA